MKRVVILVVLGVLGLFAATGVTLGALAIAGEGAGTVVHPHLAPARTSSSSPERDEGRTPTPSASPSADDDGGLEPGDDHGGSTNSGSGSSNSGSGSSGSGSSDSGSDDD